MSTTTVTPTSATAETPKLIKKAALVGEAKSPTSAVQTSFSCKHVKGLLSAASDRATSEYARLLQALRREGATNGRVHKSADGAKSTAETTYLCLQCSNVSLVRERHRKDHAFAVESSNGFIYCHECKDFIYDTTLEEVRTSSINSKKRKHSEIFGEGEKRLIANNTTVTPCAATGLRGLYNMGQTCFMSVILQSLVHNPLIRTYYLSEGHRAIDCDRDACTSCALDDIFTDFFGQEKHEGYGAVHMLQGCWKGGGGLAGYSQQDAHEYLGFILNSLHAAITEEDEDGNTNGTHKENVNRDCDCVVHQTFAGQLQSTVTCSACKNITTALDPFMDLSLDVRNAGVSVKKKKLTLIPGTSTVKETLPMDLTECLDRFTSPETLSSDSYNCRKCSSTQAEATKKLSLRRLPPVIPIHLKRFSHSKTLAQSNKVETRVRFPLSLDITPYTTSSAAKSKQKISTNGEKPSTNGAVDSESKVDKSRDDKTAVDPTYELSSVILHKGKIDNGHYISYSRQGDEWFRFDDSMVVQVHEREVLNAEAYMLFYVVRQFAAD